MTKQQQKQQKGQRVKKNKAIKHEDKSESIKRESLVKDWEERQIRGYVVYLMAFREVLGVKGKLRPEIYKEMSATMGRTKSIDECRQFHTENKIYYKKGIEKIIDTFASKISESKESLERQAAEMRKKKQEIRQWFFRQVWEAQDQQRQYYRIMKQINEKQAGLRISIFRDGLRKKYEVSEFYQRIQKIYECNDFNQNHNNKQKFSVDLIGFFDQSQNQPQMLFVKKH